MIAVSAGPPLGGLPPGPGGVPCQDRAGDHRGGSEPVAPLHDYFNVVCGENLERGALGGSRDRMGILAEEERPGDTTPGAILANGLGDGHDVGLIKRAAEG